MRKLISAMFGILLAGCTSTPELNTSSGVENANWATTLPNFVDDSASAANWWLQFNDNHLNQLIEQALANNPDLVAQQSVIEQHRASLGLAKAESWPMLGAQANAQQTRLPEQLIPQPLGGGQSQRTLHVGASLHYELDLWGRLKHQRDMQAAQLRGAEFELHAFRQMLISEVVSAYISLLTSHEHLTISNNMKRVTQEQLALTEIAYQRGNAAKTETLQQTSQLNQVRQQVNVAQQDYASAHTNLALLVGLTPERLIADFNFEHSNLAALKTVEQLPSMLPSEVLARRPDIQAAEAMLEASAAQVGVAKAARFPSINLMALVGSAAPTLANLFTGDAEFYNAGLGVSGPLYDFGRSRSRTQQAEHAFAEANARYQGVVRIAIAETIDAMQAYQTMLSQRELEAHNTEMSQQQMQIVSTQYAAGAASRQAQLAAQQAYLELQYSDATTHAQLLLSIAAVYRALGGDVEEDLG